MHPTSRTLALVVLLATTVVNIALGYLNIPQYVNCSLKGNVAPEIQAIASSTINN